MMMNSTNLNSNNQQSSSNNYNNNNNYNPASNSSDPSIFPIKSLSPYQNKWTIKARVIQKSPSVVTWKNARGEGRLFSFTLKDESGEIRVTTFNEGVDLYWDLIKENHVYLISRGSVKIVRNKQYSNVANDYEMSIDGHSSVTPCADGADVPGVEYDSAVPLDNLMNYEKDATIDVVGIVTMAGEAETLISKAQKEVSQKTNGITVSHLYISIALSLPSFSVPQT